MRVAVCVVTHRRPGGLARLLEGLAALRVPAGCALEVVVVDNDPRASARAVCDEALECFPVELRYAVEKRAGIPQARNAALALVLARADFAAFIDDDEVPEPEWLAELLAAQADHAADAVAGPCRPRFEAPPAKWIVRSGAFERAEHADGARLEHAYTHNVLVRCAALAELPALFDERLALAGGSDSELFARLAAAGRRIVWARRAVVHEWIPPSRARLAWLLRRSLRVGASTAWIRRAHASAARASLRCLAQGVWCIARGGGELLISARGGRPAAANALRLACFGAGLVWGALGQRYPEYARGARA